MFEGERMNMRIVELFGDSKEASLTLPFSGLAFAEPNTGPRRLAFGG